MMWASWQVLFIGVVSATAGGAITLIAEHSMEPAQNVAAPTLAVKRKPSSLEVSGLKEILVRTEQALLQGVSLAELSEFALQMSTKEALADDQIQEPVFARDAVIKTVALKNLWKLSYEATVPWFSDKEYRIPMEKIGIWPGTDSFKKAYNQVYFGGDDTHRKDLLGRAIGAVNISLDIAIKHLDAKQ